ncbi:(2Fe-2S)-binding protein [Labilibaculum filiforme]|uniref:Bacterioferritin-associated ferredoxin n=1 Tax=Labilibaculum filiforme TaxID=1940526 RepID=A0A2N3I2H2_9BACT|nr:(2Fe-2S)-binding protein [Labilibaculum filiforme]PKQ64509.1 (2Fe-2S)-binding protein [Labilibaculum filiforme]
MKENKIICSTNNIDYISIRKAMVAGARTLEDMKKHGLCLTCDGCKNELEKILSSVCGCNNVSMVNVIEAIKNGATTVEEVGKQTGAGTDCGRCKALIANVIEKGY